MTSVFMSDFEIEFIDSQFQEVLYDDNLKKKILCLPRIPKVF